MTRLTIDIMDLPNVNTGVLVDISNAQNQEIDSDLSRLSLRVLKYMFGIRCSLCTRSDVDVRRRFTTSFVFTRVFVGADGLGC